MKVYVSILSNTLDDDYSIFGVYSTIDKAIAEAKRWLAEILISNSEPMNIEQYEDSVSIYQNKFIFDIQEKEME